jgi:hypothetical protein
MVRTLTHQPVDRAPRSLWALQYVSTYRKEAFDAVLKRFPGDITSSSVHYTPGKRAVGEPYTVGKSVDAWGCTFDVLEPGVVGEVKHPLFEDGYDALCDYQPPWELLDGLEARRGEVALDCAATDQFVVGNTETRPFERMQFLRGTENLFVDLALNEPGSYVLRDKLHDFFLKEMRFWASTAVDGVGFMDDWGTQQSLLISPTKWREFYKPLYKEYCDILHAAGKFVFFHSDGFIEAIYPDLIEIGVDAVNSQLFCMDIEKLGALYAGKITFWGEIDRQWILPFGMPEAARAAVRRVHRAMCPSGVTTGVIAQCEWGVKDPEENIAAVFDEWNAVGAGT